MKYKEQKLNSVPQKKSSLWYLTSACYGSIFFLSQDLHRGLLLDYVDRISCGIHLGGLQNLRQNHLYSQNITIVNRIIVPLFYQRLVTNCFSAWNLWLHQRLFALVTLSLFCCA